MQVFGQDLPPIFPWRKPTIEASREERANISAAAIDMFIKSDDFFNFPVPLPDDSWPYGAFLAEMADFDIFTGQTRYKEIAQKHYLPAFRTLIPRTSTYGYAATRAYVAYKDEEFLDIAQDYWNATRSLTLSEPETSSGRSLAKPSLRISKTCSKPGGVVSLAGGTFRRTGDNIDLNITSVATAEYLALTASLGVISSNQTYFDLAPQMVHFLQTVTYRGSGLFYDVVDAKEGHNCNMSDSGPFDTGAAIQALSQVVTRNTSVMDFLQDITLGAIMNPSWHAQNGILDSERLDNSITRGRNTHYLLSSYLGLVGNDTPSDLKAYLQQYLSVQYNAAVDLARIDESSSAYGPSLLGSPDGKFNNGSQALAIAALLGGVALSSNGSLPASGNSPTPTSRVSHTPAISIASIVGGIIGGLCGVALISAIAYIYGVRRRPRDTVREAEHTVHPFTVTKSVPEPFTPISAQRSPILPPSPPEKSHRYTTESAAQGLPLLATSPTDTEATRPARQSQIHEATTAELVMVLNDRLRNERWDGNERPPEYPRSNH
ncbi:hypothetical protein V5O48_012707 [Marasmius crinis-equi]|uniref:Glycoside hydrolase family 76 protein n=1 Tax=Marasmius crinis-equi TaxID=585013 RepID=A0ABR3F224_9AGAR